MAKTKLLAIIAIVGGALAIVAVATVWAWNRSGSSEESDPSGTIEAAVDRTFARSALEEDLSISLVSAPAIEALYIKQSGSTYWKTAQGEGLETISDSYERPAGETGWDRVDGTPSGAGTASSFDLASLVGGTPSFTDERDLGDDQIDGVPVEHHQAALRAELLNGAADVWIGDDGLVRRVLIVNVLSTGAVVKEVALYLFSPPQTSIPAPSPIIGTIAVGSSEVPIIVSTSVPRP
jgi:hypothetical protein